jgi:hypothetical protein
VTGERGEESPARAMYEVRGPRATPAAFTAEMFFLPEGKV